MGLAASQARLLSITSRMADNELRSQTINNAKMRLASESALASENYINALNNANMMFTNYAADGTAMTQALTYNSLMSYSSYNNQYGLVNTAGQLLVSEDEAQIFAQANGNLNEYLLAHGIEYDTTYFEPGVDGQTVRIENPDYPAEFQDVDAETLKEWYENYNSYVNSAEYKYYNDYLSQYLDDSRAYRGALSYMLDDYVENITSTMRSKLGNKPADWHGNGIGAIGDLYNALEPYFTNNGTVNNVFKETYNQMVWKLQTWVKVKNPSEVTGCGWPGTTIQEANANATTENGVTTYKYYIGWDSRELQLNSDGEYEPVGEDTRDYIAFEVYMDGNTEKCKVYTSYAGDYDKDNSNLICSGNDCKVKVYKRDENGNLVTDSKGNYIEEYKYVSLTAYEMALYNLDSAKTSYDSKAGSWYGKIVDQNGNAISSNFDDGFNKYATLNDDGKVNKDSAFGLSQYNAMSIVYKSADNFYKFLQEVAQSLTNLTKNDDYFNMAAFGNGIVADYENNNNGSSSNMGITYSTEINQTGMKYKDYIENYEKSAIAYFGLIEEGLVEVPDDPKLTDLTDYELYKILSQKNAQETYNDLVNLDRVLEIIKDYNIEYSEEFANIVKACIVDTMIDEYGEPKYAWVDRTDTTNTGNADAKAQWYTNLFERMSKGYKVLENGLAASPEWLEFALETGIVTMEQVDKSEKWNSISYKTCTNITEETNTSALVAKAEAEYNKAMREIEAKDRAFDMELKNIDTEHSSLEKEYDSIKNAIKANIDRTMKFDQSS